MRIGPISILPILQVKNLGFSTIMGLAQGLTVSKQRSGIPALIFCRWKNGIQIMFLKKEKKEKDKGVVTDTWSYVPSESCPLSTRPANSPSASQAQQKDVVNWLFLHMSSASRAEEGPCV